MNDKRFNRRVDYTGKVIGFWTVEKFLYTENHIQRYLCRDIFGNTSIIKMNRFKRSNFGYKLINKESIKLRRALNSRYGNILRRCYNSDNKSFRYYGAKGIVVCDEWLGEKGFINFVCWAAKNGFKSNLFIDRIDNSKGYSPENCRWVTPKESLLHRSDIKLTVGQANKIRDRFKSSNMQKTIFIDEVSKELGMCRTTITNVLNNKIWN